MNRIHRLRRDESGMSYVFIGMSMMAFLSASMLAIDVGMLMTARNQAQNSADAGSLAGATALVMDDYANRTSSGPAVVSALAGATANQVMRTNVSVTPADVEFPNDPAGNPSRVKVTVYRQAARGNPVATLVAQLFGINSADIVATATAEAAPANSATCIKPFTIPDRWTERQTPSWDPTDTFTAYPKNPSLQPDVYYPTGNPSYPGYDPARDRGVRLTVRPAGASISSGGYYAVALPGSSGAGDFQSNLQNCNTGVMGPSTDLTKEAAAVTAEMTAGIQALIARDPPAYWDTGANKVVSDMHPSPRTLVVPLYDPYFFDTGKNNGHPADLKATNFVGFFIESISGTGDVTGRITNIVGVRNGSTPAPSGMFAKSIRLVQ